MAQSRTTEIVIPGYLRVSKIITWLLYFWVLVGVISLTLRVFLLAFSANMTAGFARFVMDTSTDYLEPFRGLFIGRNIGDTGYLDVSAFFAIIVYLFIAWGFHSLINYVQYRIDLSAGQQEEALAKQSRQTAVATKKAVR